MTAPSPTHADLIITPATCQANRWRVSVYCQHCSAGRMVMDFDAPGWRRHWDEEIEGLWRRGVMRCSRCKAPAGLVDVHRELPRGGKFETLLSLRWVPVVGTIGAGDVAREWPGNENAPGGEAGGAGSVRS